MAYLDTNRFDSLVLDSSNSCLWDESFGWMDPSRAVDLFNLYFPAILPASCSIINRSIGLNANRGSLLIYKRLAGC